MIIQNKVKFNSIQFPGSMAIFILVAICDLTIHCLYVSFCLILKKTLCLLNLGLNTYINIYVNALEMEYGNCLSKLNISPKDSRLSLMHFFRKFKIPGCIICTYFSLISGREKKVTYFCIS